MDSEVLTSIGLSPGESRVYLALLRLGQTRTGALASSARVSSSKVYKILDRLEKKGLAGHVVKERTKYFRAVEPRRIIDYLDEEEADVRKRREALRAMLPDISREADIERMKEEAVVFDGFKAVSNFYRNILDELRAGDSYCVIGATYGLDLPGWRAFYQKYHQLRSQKGIHVKMLANHNVVGNLVEATTRRADIRYLPEYIITNMTIVFYHDKSFIIIWTRDPKGFLIQSEDAVRSFQAYFDAFWKIAKPAKALIGAH